MWLYVIIFLILSFFSILELLSSNKKFSHIVFSVIILVFFILSFIRWETGTDWDSYYTIYEWIKVPWEDMDNGMELGYNIISHLGKFVFDSYTGVLFFLAIIIYSCTVRSYLYFTPYPITALLWAYCISFASIFFVRQNVALAILLVSLIHVHKREIWPFLFCVFIASLFHRTAWIFVLVYPIYTQYFKFKTLLIGILVSIVLSMLISQFLLSFISSLGLGIISQKIELYLDLGADDNHMVFSTTTVLVKGLINRLVLLALFFVYLDKFRKDDVMLNGLLNIYILGTILYCATLPISISLARVAVYMDIVQIFIVSNLFGFQRDLANKKILFLLLLLYFSMRLYTSYKSFEEEYIPFETILD